MHNENDVEIRPTVTYHELSTQEQQFFRNITKAVEDVQAQARGALGLACATRGLKGKITISGDCTQLIEEPEE
jgi:hypothetical protein